MVHYRCQTNVQTVLKKIPTPRMPRIRIIMPCARREMLGICCLSTASQSYIYKESQQNLRVAILPNKIYFRNGLPCVLSFISGFCSLACLKMFTNRNSLKWMLNLQVTVCSVKMGLNQYND